MKNLSDLMVYELNQNHSYVWVYRSVFGFYNVSYKYDDVRVKDIFITAEQLLKLQSFKTVKKACDYLLSLDTPTMHEGQSLAYKHAVFVVDYLCDDSDIPSLPPTESSSSNTLAADDGANPFSSYESSFVADMAHDKISVLSLSTARIYTFYSLQGAYSLFDQTVK